MARQHRVRILNKKRFKQSQLSPEQMITLGTALRNTVRDRIRMAANVYDAAAPPLKPGYLRFKVTRFGGQPVRDWWRTGRTLRSFQVLTVGVNRAVIGFTDAVSNFRAFINNRRHRQFGVSPRDRANLIQSLRNIFHSIYARRAA